MTILCAFVTTCTLACVKTLTEAAESVERTAREGEQDLSERLGSLKKPAALSEKDIKKNSSDDSTDDSSDDSTDDSSDDSTDDSSDDSK